MSNPQSAGPAAPTSFLERRTSVRRPMRCKVTLTLNSGATLSGTAIDLSAGGMSFIVPLKLHVGEQCHMRFDPYVGGRLHRIVINAQVRNEVCIGMDGFRVGVSFDTPDTRIEEIVSQLTGAVS